MAKRERVVKRIIGIYLFISVFFTTIYLVSFHSPLFNSQSVLFYRGITLLFFTTVVTIILAMFCYFKWLKINLESIIAAIIFMFAIHLTIFILFPVTFDRSITMYMLNDLNKNLKNHSVCNGLTKQKLTFDLINDYTIEKDAVGKRINEQGIINFIHTNKQCIQLTQKGIDFIGFSELIKKIYGLNSQ